MRIARQNFVYLDDRTDCEIKSGGWELRRLSSVNQDGYHFRGLASLFILLRDNPEAFNISRKTWATLVAECEEEERAR